MSWRARASRWQPPTLREVVISLQENINQAARNEQNARAAQNLYQPGDERLGMAMEDEAKFQCEQKHWRTYLAYYRGLLDRHPDLADRPAEQAIKRDRGPRPEPVRMGAVIPLPNPRCSDEIADEEIPF